MRTLVVVSHPYFNNSKVIKTLLAAASSVDNVEVRNLEELYGSDFNAIDVKAEQEAHERADRIVYLFPIHWFNLTPMLKAYMNVVWGYNWAFGPAGYALAGKELQVITSAGCSTDNYSQEGLLLHSAREILSPLEASAMFCSMTYLEPLFFYGAGFQSDEDLANWSQVVKTRLESPLGSHVLSVSKRKPA
ncbi:NAD(P)H dehydrogenase [Psittacicella hinzii]|uniref:NAD(P)H dehydrogenase n=1 Tax=Psittacicella hinzii TaxID=2028575 RepID=A0A3A1Y0S8_9GAMM|nr:NAD(P)H-dependent oxidoreductase [Psittacicella hinzii]RIY31195.1 NAD(P)H dehydrogenase [Psittacicella hinzii]